MDVHRNLIFANENKVDKSGEIVYYFYSKIYVFENRNKNKGEFRCRI